MASERDGAPRGLPGKVELHDNAKAVFAETVNTLNIHHYALPSFAANALFATVSPLPGNFVERPEISEPLVADLLSDASAFAALALEGMAGAGKSVLALTVCHDSRIQQAFSDGIVWLTLGKDSSLPLSKRIEVIASALNLQFRTYNQAAYQSMMRDRAVLIVLDDVWDLEVVEHFRPPLGRSRLLYTSRDRTFAGSLGAKSHEVRVLELEQARKFLLRWSGRAERLPPESYLEGILAECKGLVLALAMIGAALRGQTDYEWRVVLEDLREARIKETGSRPAGYQYGTIHASISVSVDALDARTKRSYRLLSVLLEDMPAPEVLLQQLWGGDSAEVHRVTRKLIDRSLATRDASGALRLHDLQLDYLQSEHSDRSSLKLIHESVIRSFHVLQSQPEQFGSQVIARLLPHAALPGVAAFLCELDTHATRPRLRPIKGALQPAGGHAARILNERARISAVALSGDGHWAAAGSPDETLRIWDLEGLSPPRILEGHSGRISGVALSADGRWILSGSDDMTLRLWDLKATQPPRILEGHRGKVSAVALSADGRWALSDSEYDDALLLHDLQGIHPPYTLEGDGYCHWTFDVALSADGRCAIAASGTGALLVWEAGTHRKPTIFEGHRGAIHAVALSANGRWALSGSDDKTVRFWDLSGKLSPRLLEGHSDSAYAVALSADGHRALSGSRDQTLRVWNLQNEMQSGRAGLHGDSVYSIALTADGKFCLSRSFDTVVRLWDLQVEQPPRLFEGHSGIVRSISLSADGRWAISGGDDRTLRLWDLRGRQSPRVLEGHNGVVRSVAISADGCTALFGSSDGTVRVWDLSGERAPRTLNGHQGDVIAVALSADGCWALAGSLCLDRPFDALVDRSLHIWNLDSEEPARSLQGIHSWTRAVALSRDGRWALSGAEDNILYVWDLKNEQLPRKLEGHSGSVYAAVFSADGHRTLTGSADATLRVWDLTTFSCLSVFSSDAVVLNCAWAENRIAAADTSGFLHLFDWQN